MHFQNLWVFTPNSRLGCFPSSVKQTVVIVRHSHILRFFCKYALKSNVQGLSNNLQGA